jgi:hypothetical protein
MLWATTLLLLLASQQQRHGSSRAPWHLHDTSMSALVVELALLIIRWYLCCQWPKRHPIASSPRCDSVSCIRMLSS